MTSASLSMLSVLEREAVAALLQLHLEPRHAPVLVPAPVSPMPAPVSPVPALVWPVPATVSPVPTPLSPGPAPVSPMPAPVSPVPAPLSPVPALVWPVPATVSPVPTPLSPVPPPVSPMPAPVSPVPALVSPMPAPVSPVPAPLSPVPAWVNATDAVHRAAWILTGFIKNKSAPSAPVDHSHKIVVTSAEVHTFERSPRTTQSRPPQRKIRTPKRFLNSPEVQSIEEEEWDTSEMENLIREAMLRSRNGISRPPVVTKPLARTRETIVTSGRPRARPPMRLSTNQTEAVNGDSGDEWQPTPPKERKHNPCGSNKENRTVAVLEKVKDNNSGIKTENDLVPIGDGHARIPARVLKTLNWESYTNVTRKLLTAVFPRSVLATHSLTGKPSPAFPNKPAKQKLDPSLVNDIVQTVVEGCGVQENMVRTSITTKCADESKMLRSRQRNGKS